MQDITSGKLALNSYEAPDAIGRTCHFNCKRRVHMVSHLKEVHGISEDSYALAIAKDSLRSSGRSFWGCGFCVTLFISFSDRIRHIAKQHFEAGMTIEDWDVRKVIKGLLSQRMVNQAWKPELGGETGFSQPGTAWHASNTDRLQYLLEMGASNLHDGYSLAKAAYEASGIGSSHRNQGDLMSPFRSQPLPTHTSLLNSVPQGTRTDVSHSPLISQAGQSSTQAAFDIARYHSTAFQDPPLPFSSDYRLSPMHIQHSDFLDSTIGQTTTHQPQGLDERAHPTEYPIEVDDVFDDIVHWDG